MQPSYPPPIVPIAKYKGQNKLVHAIQQMQEQHHALMLSLGVNAAAPIDLSRVDADGMDPDQPSTQESQESVMLIDLKKKDDENKKKAAKEKRQMKKQGLSPPPKQEEPPKVLELPDVAVANECVWVPDQPTELLNGFVADNKWHLDANTDRQRLYKACHENVDMSLEYYFFSVFPTHYLPTIVQLTNEQIVKDSDKRWRDKHVSQQELLNFFGIVLLIPRLPEMERRDLWKEVAKTKYTVPGCLNRTGMNRNRFECILRNIRFSHQPQHRASHVNNLGFGSCKPGD